MKRNALSLALVAGLSLGAAAPASASFIGYYGVSNWTTTLNNGGTVNTSGAPGQIAVTSGNSFGDNFGGPAGDTDFTIAAQAAGLVSFNWSFTTNDLDASFDPFGYLLNGVFTQLTNNALSGQSGIASFAVTSGDIFGFRAHTEDNGWGAGTGTVSNFNAPASSVPEPGTLALLVLGGALAARRRKV